MIITFLGTTTQRARADKTEKSRPGMLSVYCTFHILVIVTQYVKRTETVLLVYPGGRLKSSKIGLTIQPDRVSLVKAL
jgi:hypothetical protein